MAKSNAERQRAYRERQKRARLEAQAGTGEATAIEKPVPAGRRTQGDKLDDIDIDRWLSVIEQGYSKRRAAAEVGHSARTLKMWRDKSPENEARYREAFLKGNEVIRDEITRRGIHGYEEVTKNGKGEVVRTVHRYSDSLAKLAAAARMPEEYRDNYVSASTPTVLIVHSPFAAVMPDEAIEVEATELPQLEEGK